MSGISELRPNPFVGPRPIQLGEALHGRATEVRELFEQVKGNRVVVLHSPSGAGKSSLVSAGLIPRLRKNKFDVWRPIRVNLDPAGFADLPASANRYLLSALVSLEDELPPERRRSPAALAELDFLAYLDGRPRRKGRAEQSVVLIFDQFEEILSVDPRAIAAKRAFFSAIGAALDTGRYWALFVIREDYLAALAPYRDLIPTQLSNTYRLDLLGLDGAREAATSLASAGGRSFPGVDRLIRDLSIVQVQQPDGCFVAEQGIHVEPVYLQVVCRRLWAAMPDDAEAIDEASVEAYAQVSKSLAGYYADAVAAIAGADAALERAIRDWVGTRLIVGGIRSQVRQQAGGEGGVASEHIERLLDSYLIRSEQRAGANWYELSHDRLVEPVLEDNEAWQQSHLHPLQVQAKLWLDGGRSRELLLAPEAMAAAQEWAASNHNLLTADEREFLELSRERRDQLTRQRRVRRGFTAGLALVAVVALSLAVVAANAQRESEQARDAAEQARERAELEQRKAQAAHEQAEAERATAEQARADAEQARTVAERSQKENERSVRQMFEVALRPLTERLIAREQAVGALELDNRWTPLLARGDRAMVAASLGERVRIVVVGSEAALGESDAKADSLLLEITTQWLLADQVRRKVAIVTQQPERYRRLEALERNLLRFGYQVEISPALLGEGALAEVGMLVLDNRWTPALSAEEIGAIAAFVERGGGVLAIGDGPGWLAGPTRDGAAPILVDYPMYGALASFGVRWSDQSVGPRELAEREIPAIVRFENKLAEAIKLHTRKGEREELYDALAPGEARDLLTTVGSEWVVRASADGREIDVVVIEDAEQVLSIGATVAKTRTKAKPASEPVVDEAHDRPRPTAQLQDSLASEDLQAGLSEARSAAKRCGKELGTLMSDVTVKLEIDGAGKVASVSVLPPAKGTPEGACVADAVEQLGFAKSKNGGEATWKLKLY